MQISLVQDPRAERLRQNDAARMASLQAILCDEMRDGVASRNVLIGELFMANGALYSAIRNIPNGADLVEGVNVVRTNVEEQLNLLQEGE